MWHGAAHEPPATCLLSLGPVLHPTLPPNPSPCWMSSNSPMGIQTTRKTSLAHSSQMSDMSAWHHDELIMTGTPHLPTPWVYLHVEGLTWRDWDLGQTSYGLAFQRLGLWDVPSTSHSPARLWPGLGRYLQDRRWSKYNQPQVEHPIWWASRSWLR